MDGHEEFPAHPCGPEILRAARSARGPDEAAVVGAVRRLILEHERDPRDGSLRTFGGRDEARLLSALNRLDASVGDKSSIERRLGADVAIQRMGMQRSEEIAGGVPHRGFEARDRAAVGGDASAIAREAGHFAAGNLAMGRYDRLPRQLGDWVADSIGSAASRRVASPLRDQAASLPPGPPIRSKGPESGTDAVGRAWLADRARRGR